MKFLVTWMVFETITQEQAKPLRAGFAQGIEHMFDSPKIKDAGGFGDARGMYMILEDVTSAEEITEILGPEMLDNGHVEVHPIVPLERAAEVFQQWAQQGR